MIPFNLTLSAMLKLLTHLLSINPKDLLRANGLIKNRNIRQKWVTYKNFELHWAIFLSFFLEKKFWEQVDTLFVF